MRAGVGTVPAAGSSMATQKETVTGGVGSKSAESKDAVARTETPAGQEERVEAGSGSKPTCGIFRASRVLEHGCSLPDHGPSG